MSNQNNIGSNFLAQLTSIGPVEHRKSTERITPEVAARMLERNTGNRRLREALVRRYTDAMKRGEWRYNGDTIRFGRSGRLLAGQHRLHAVIRSGATIVSDVVYDVDDDAIVTMDTGASWSGGDLLSYHGEKNGNHLSPALAAINAYTTGQIWIHGWQKPSNDKIIALLRAHPSIRDSAKWSSAVASVCGNRTVAIACHYLFSKVDTRDADRFMTDLSAGAMLEKGDPVLLLRNRLIDDRAAKGAAKKIPRGYMMALFIKAWNARRTGRKVQVLRLRLDGDCPEPFPRVHGLAEHGGV